MSKVLFAYTGKIRKNDKGEYFGQSLTNEVFKRYELLAENVSLSLRVINVSDNETKNLSKISEKYKVIELPNTRTIKGILQTPELKKRIKDAVSESDYVVARIPSSYAYVAIDNAIKMNKPYMVEVVGCSWDSLWNHSLKGKVLALPSMLRMKKYCKNAPYLVYVSSEFLQKRYPSKGIQTGCSDVILPEPKQSTLENRLKKIEQAKAPLTLGTLAAVDVAYKGQQYVIEALAKLKQQGQIYHYEIAGSGDQSCLKSLAEKLQVADQVKFLGSIPHAQVPAWLDSIDIYIQPSNQEGLCRSLIEAMSRACPCVASDAGGDPELLDPAFIFKKKHVAQLISELQSLATPSTMTAQARRNFSEAKKYTNDEISKRRNKLYEKFKSDNKRTKTC